MINKQNHHHNKSLSINKKQEISKKNILSNNNIININNVSNYNINNNICLTISNNNFKKKEVINISGEISKNKLKRNHSKSRNNNKDSIMKLNTTFKKGLLSEFFKTNINDKKENKKIINYNNNKTKINQNQKISSNLINTLTKELILKNKYNVSKEQSKLFKKKIIKLRNNKNSFLYFNNNIDNINKINNNKLSFEIEKLIGKNPHFNHSKSNIKKKSLNKNK